MLIQCFCVEQDMVLEKTSIVMLSFLLMKPRYSINLEEALEPVPQTLCQSGRSIQACCSILTWSYGSYPGMVSRTLPRRTGLHLCWPAVVSHQEA